MTYDSSPKSSPPAHQPAPGNTPGRDDADETVVGTVDARQGGRQKMNVRVLMIGMLLAGLGFFVAWFLEVLPL